MMGTRRKARSTESASGAEVGCPAPAGCAGRVHGLRRLPGLRGVVPGGGRQRPGRHAALRPLRLPRAPAQHRPGVPHPCRCKLHPGGRVKFYMLMRPQEVLVGMCRAICLQNYSMKHGILLRLEFTAVLPEPSLVDRSCNASVQERATTPAIIHVHACMTGSTGLRKAPRSPDSQEVPLFLRNTANVCWHLLCCCD